MEPDTYYSNTYTYTYTVETLDQLIKKYDLPSIFGHTQHKWSLKIPTEEIPEY